MYYPSSKYKKKTSVDLCKVINTPNIGIRTSEVMNTLFISYRKTHTSEKCIDYGAKL